MSTVNKLQQGERVSNNIHKDDECACTHYFFLCCLLVDQYHKILCEEGKGDRTSYLLL